MTWFLNHYHCGDCDADWEDEWSCCCDDDCPEGGSRHWSPLKSDDLTFVVEPEDGRFAVYESPLSAEDKPRYARVAVAPSAEDNGVHHVSAGRELGLTYHARRETRFVQ